MSRICLDIDDKKTQYLIKLIVKIKNIINEAKQQKLMAISLKQLLISNIRDLRMILGYKQKKKCLGNK